MADARYAAGAGADFVGFVQYRQSPRYIEPTKVRDIIEWLHGPVPVGVFVDAPVHLVQEVSDVAGFQLVQLHGSESPDYCDEIGLPVIKSFALQPNESASELGKRMTPYIGVVDYALVDTYAPKAHGGTGQLNRFDELRTVRYPLPLLVAGGLTPENVGTIVEALTPFGVDVSSGVEEAPGVKDYDKIDAFMGMVKAVANLDDESAI